ncbi:MAG: hypothetical protein QGH33_07860 [Pirellulaceae bacterium]|jgi:hypothetical protein|nr:hypothetical protein [Pirellulaceae bacterium]HJN13093.1 hypothetical protein [Pirellulaceae bacterium]
MSAPRNARRDDLIECEVSAALSNSAQEDLQVPISLRVKGRDYPPNYQPLDRMFLLQQAMKLTEPFQKLALSEFRALPFSSLPSASRQQPHERAKSYYASIAQLAQRQEELAKFSRALIAFSLCRRSDPHKQELTTAERHFVSKHVPQLHPVSCPVLDVEQNAKEPPQKIEQQIETALWNASRSLAFDTLNVMHTLVLARVLGRIDWFDNDGCRFFYYENQILQAKRWPAIHVCEAVAVTPRHVIVGGVRASSKVRHLLRAIPSWLKRYVMFVEGTKIKSTTVISDEVTDHHLPACQLYCLTLGSYVFQGWTEEEVPRFWRV